MYTIVLQFIDHYLRSCVQYYLVTTGRHLLCLWNFNTLRPKLSPGAFHVRLHNVFPFLGNLTGRNEVHCKRSHGTVAKGKQLSCRMWSFKISPPATGSNVNLSLENFCRILSHMSASQRNKFVRGNVKWGLHAYQNGDASRPTCVCTLDL